MNKHDDILDQIAEEARRLHVARKLPDGKLSWDWVRRVQQDFEEFLQTTGLTQGKVARKMGEGYSPSIISTFTSLQDDHEYIGDRDRIARGINNFMGVHARRTKAPRPAGWIETAVARRMLNLIAKTIELRSMGLIYSDAGRGKTMTLEAAAKLYPGAINVRVISGTRSPAGLARLLGHALRLRRVSTTLDIQLKLHDTLKGTDRPLLIDEAHQLSAKALEFLRDLHDVCEVPIVLAGTKKIEEATGDTDEFYGQLSSRVALRYDVTEDLRAARDGGHDPKPLHTVDEIIKMFQSDKLRLTSDGAHTLATLANLEGLGGLRLCKQVVLVAAGVCKDKPISGKLILQVLRKMHGLDHGVRAISRAIDESRVAIA